LDLRQKVVEASVNKEGSIRKLAERFKISKNAVSSFIARFRSTENITPKHREVPGNLAKVDKEKAHYLEEVVQREPDLTLGELCQWFIEFRISNGYSSISPPWQVRGIDARP
jgi:putative transposase